MDSNPQIRYKMEWTKDGVKLTKEEENQVKSCTPAIDIVHFLELY